MDPAGSAGGTGGAAQILYAIGALIAAAVSGVALFRRHNGPPAPIELVDDTGDPDDRPGRIRERLAQLEAAVRDLRRDIEREHPRARRGRD